MERAIWSYQSQGDPWNLGDGELTVAAYARAVMFSVEEEKAMDSYNRTFNCQCLVPWDKVDELIALLTAARREAT